MTRDPIQRSISWALALGCVAGLISVVAVGLRPVPQWAFAAVISVLAAQAWLLFARVSVVRSRERAERNDRDRSSSAAATHALAARDGIAAVLDAVPEPVIATDATGVVRYSNIAARDLFDALGTVSRSIEDVFTHGEVLSIHARALVGTPGQARVRLQHRGVLRVFEVIATPRPDPTPPRFGVVITLRDVTELALAVQLKTDFVANASHELRTPLASIRLAMETLREAGPEDASLAERLSNVVLRNTARLEDLVRDLLDLSRVEAADVPPARELVSMSEMVAEVEQMFEEVCRTRRLKIEADLDSNATEFISDPRLLEMILKNLVENATKYAFEGTTIRIRATRVTPESTSSATPPIRISVSDQGVGIPISLQQRIFERFYQVDGARSGPTDRRGTGLGLAIVKHAIKRLGGSISVESVWQQGTTMTIEFIPAEVASPEDGMDADSPTASRTADTRSSDPV